MGQALTDGTESRYLERLAASAAGLPPESREDLLDEIRTHIAEARAAGEVHDEASLRQLLDRLGEPEEIVAAASADETQPVAPPVAFATQPPMSYRQPGIGLEIAAFILITVGSIVPIIGWLVGVILLWTSRRLTTAEKLLATLVVPGGPLLAIYLGGAGALVATGQCRPIAPPDASGNLVTQTSGTGSGGTALFIALLAIWLIAPVIMAIVLLKRARSRADLETPIPVYLSAPVSGRWGGLEIASVLLLTVGGFVVPVIGPIVGLILAWNSQRWSSREKWIATAIMFIAPLLVLVLARTFL